MKYLNVLKISTKAKQNWRRAQNFKFFKFDRNRANKWAIKYENELCRETVILGLLNISHHHIYLLLLLVLKSGKYSLLLQSRTQKKKK